MAVSEYFAHSYSEARTKFLAAACTAGSHLAHRADLLVQARNFFGCCGET